MVVGLVGIETVRRGLEVGMVVTGLSGASVGVAGGPVAPFAGAVIVSSLVDAGADEFAAGGVAEALASFSSCPAGALTSPGFGPPGGSVFVSYAAFFYFFFLFAVG